MNDKKNTILNIVIVILVITLICVIVSIFMEKNKVEIVNESTYRQKLKENITYEYVTKPEEEQNAMIAEDERIRNEEMQNEEIKDQEEMANEMVRNIEQGAKF